MARSHASITYHVKMWASTPSIAEQDLQAILVNVILVASFSRIRDIPRDSIVSIPNFSSYVLIVLLYSIIIIWHMRLHLVSYISLGINWKYACSQIYIVRKRCHALAVFSIRIRIRHSHVNRIVATTPNSPDCQQ